MRNAIFSILLLASLAGCATTSKPGGYGSYAAVGPAGETAVVQDVVKRLVVAYPPARTRLNMRHPATDSFGTALVASMRAKGYALDEHKPAPAATAASRGFAFAYAFDRLAGTDLYSVTLYVDNDVLSRVYESKDGALAPAGYWARKE